MNCTLLYSLYNAHPHTHISVDRMSVCLSVRPSIHLSVSDLNFCSYTVSSSSSSSSSSSTVRITTETSLSLSFSPCTRVSNFVAGICSLSKVCLFVRSDFWLSVCLTAVCVVLFGVLRVHEYFYD